MFRLNQKTRNLAFIAQKQKQPAELVIREIGMADIAAQGVDVAAMAQIIGNNGAAALFSQAFSHAPDGLVMLACIPDSLVHEPALDPAPVILTANEGPAPPVFGILGGVHLG